MQDDVAPRGLEYISKLLKRDVVASRSAQRKSADLPHTCSGIGRENDRNIHDPISVIDLPYGIAAEGCPDRVKHHYRVKTPTSQILLLEPDHHLRHSWW